MKDFGKFIGNKRKAALLTQAELGEEIGLSRSGVSMIETGANRPSVETAKEIGRVLQFPWHLIYEDAEQ